MSGVDPLAGAVAANADLAALIDAELAQLAADAQALRGLLVEDAVVPARVLPSNGLTDLLEIAGRRVAASLPPTVRPGDVVQVRVAGFEGDRILLQIVATGADAAVEPGPPNAPLAPQPGAFVPASIQPAPSPDPAAGTGAASGPSSAAGTAFDVPAGGSSALPVAPVPGRPGAAAAFASAAARANVGPSQGGEAAGVHGGDAASPTPAGASHFGVSQPFVTQRAPVAAPGEPTSIEARVAAARAAVSQSAGGGHRFVAPPQIATRTARGTPAQPAAPAQSGAPAVAARASALAAYAEPVALLRALRLPVTPSNVSSAALALQRPDRLPAALAALEAALPRGNDDPHVATLRILLDFVGRIDPGSPALESQIAAYVDHVVDGAEPKLATLLAATRAAADPAGAAAEPPGGRTGGASGGAPHAGALRPLASAVAAERGAALSGDLKQTLLALAADPATPASLGPALAGALTALTAVQLDAAQTLAAFPDRLAFTVPLTTQQGTSNAHISVKRDAPEGRGATVDPENFRIAFVLDTAHYGTVAIDLVTVGREVTVDVRTEAAPAMRAFRDALGTLTARLESLRYRVASAGASVGTTSTVAVEAAPSRPADPSAVVDRSA